MVAAVAFLFSSCKESLPKRFDNFADKVEKNADKYTEDDWQKANAEFKTLVDEYEQNKDSYSEEDIKEITAAMGKYVGLATRSGFNTVIDAVNNVIKQIPSFFETLGEGVNGFLKGLGLESQPED